MAELPSGTVSFLFTDVEGSTRHELGAEGYAAAIHEHRRLHAGRRVLRGVPDWLRGPSPRRQS